MISLLAALTLGLSFGPLVNASSEQSEQAPLVKPKRGHANNLYIVQMVDMPVSSYTGGIPGFRATKPAPGRKIDRLSNDVVRYAGHLVSKHDAALARAGGRKVYSYTYSFNGFAAELDAAAVERLKATPGVISVSKDEMRVRDTNTTPAFLGLTGATGVWTTQFGGPQNAGEGMVVGMLDTGIWPENPSFSDRDANGKLVFHQIPGFHGKCTPGEQFPASKCGQKLVAAQYFGEGFGGRAGVKAAFPYEYWSARDADGHGSHTSSTAAGNFGVAASAAGFNLGQISGMAPRARISTYKVCWGRGDEGGCFSSDSVAAIDQAVGDGVDVINFSISGTSTNFLDPVEIAFLFAADAGVFVAASAGNSGPTPGTVAHPGPWLTTVAAGTEAASSTGTVTLGNGAVYTGASIGGTVTSTPTVLSTAAGLPSANATEVRLCFIGTLDPAVVNGKIVVCDRGENARTDKSAAVKQAGGVGMILANTSANSLNADLHSVPTVHVDHIAGPAIKAYVVAAGPNATASLAGGIPANVPAPDVAAFSSRGPLRASGDLLKPDIMAPGVDILAAVSPAAGGRNFDFLSGTSMSSPHMAGLGALMKQKYPTWSPMAIKSAFMTTATPLRTPIAAGPIAGGPFDYGAGHVVPKGAVDPGLVYDSGFVDWVGFICGTGQLPASSCTGSGIPVVEPSNLNQASIAVDGLAGIQTVTRTVRNVSASALALTPTVTGLAGFGVTFSPATLNVARGATATYTVTFTRTTAPLNAYVAGAITWTGGNYLVRSPVVLRPVALAAPAEVAATPAGASYTVQFGFNGSFTTTPRGLIPAAKTAGTVADDPDNNFDPSDLTGTVAITVAVPAGITYARFSLFDADVAPGSDIDLYVFRGANFVGGSGSGTSAEEVNLTNPIAGTYTVYVHGWQTAGGAPSPFKLHTWLLGSADAGNMTVTPASATVPIGSTVTISLSFTSLAAATKYLGSVVYGGDPATATVAPTIVRVNTP